MLTAIPSNSFNDRSGWVSLNTWLDSLGVSSVTGWRWRKRGWLTTVIVGSRHYLRPEDIARFEARAVAGELASKTTAVKN
jgi:predicted site-specific integrase-resolvase